ncbi:deleted in malignant brain tumors 1 protein-like [Trematomus bernacchii]|uniref:deleted in malignant brain tumors 1 protein-like n=1 Tax=Trematomus bernacchii TaxID=40690 RepID=UPI00146E36AE|nr:deleted in malignant brain tumors 1 protein-like [Trematomus bernacchii]
MWTKEFQCGGHESALLDCSSASERNTCSPGRAVSLTCSEPVRLVGGSSRCEGDLELKYQGEWSPVYAFYEPWTLKEAAVACRDLDCGSAVSLGEREESSERPIWGIFPLCLQSGSALRECAVSATSTNILNLICSDLLQPNISVSSSMYGVSGAQQQGFQVFRGSTFSISCSIQPQYPGGSFLLSSSTHTYTQPAVNHRSHFLFPAAEPAHQGNYSCVYHVLVRSHSFCSESRLLSVTVSDPEPFIIRAVVLPLTLLLLVTVGVYFYCKATRGRRPSRQEDIELDYDDIELEYDDLGVPAEEEGAPGAE